MNSDEVPHFRDSLKRLLDGKELSFLEVNDFLTKLVAGPFDETTAAAVLTAWRMRGETGEEIAHAVRTMRQFQVNLPLSPGPLLDTCGTGGDESGTFNISTAVSIVVAGCGVRVVKHGNRAVSSRSGSADVLQELGVAINAPIDTVVRTFESIGYGFCFAPLFHPALAKVAPLRKKLGIRTIFNLLGPLLNPAKAQFHLLGVGIPELLDTLSVAMRQLECTRAVLVSGRNRFDEVSLAGPTDVRVVTPDRIATHTWTAQNFGLEPVENREILAKDASESAHIIRRVLDGERGPAQRIVLANAAAALFAVGRIDDLREGVELVRSVIESGKAKLILHRLQTYGAEG